MIEGWKDIAAYYERRTARSMTAEAMRKFADRDEELRRIVQTSFGKPAIPRYELDRWIAMRSMTRKPRLRRIVKALVECGQLALL